MVSPSTGPTMQGEAAADEDEEADRAERRAAPAPLADRDQADAGGEHDQHRLEHEAELRDAEVELGLEGRQPEQKPPVSADRAQPSSPRRARCSGCPAAAFARRPSTSRTAMPTSVIAAPPISIRCVGPQSVTSWPKRRCHTSSSGKPISEKAPQAQTSTPPSGAYQSSRDPHRGRARPLLGQHHREEAGAEDAEQAGEDEVVRGVGQRALVAADADVQRDVPVHAEHGGDQRHGGDARGQRGPARQAAHALGEVGPAPEQRDRARSGGPCRATSARR